MADALLAFPCITALTLAVSVSPSQVGWPQSVSQLILYERGTQRGWDMPLLLPSLINLTSLSMLQSRGYWTPPVEDVVAHCPGLRVLVSAGDFIREYLDVNRATCILRLTALCELKLNQGESFRATMLPRLTCLTLLRTRGSLAAT